MSARTKARKRAIDLLFEAEQRGVNARDLLAERLAKPVTEAPLNQYTADLVEGVVGHWTDINELLHCPDVPDGVAVSEAVEMAARLSTDESAAFVNGVLAKVAQEHARS